jgi:glutamate-1-semialdehyde 2,1-aminomutase
LDVLSSPGVYERLSAVGGRLRRGIEESGRRHGFPTQASGEDSVFGVRFLENEQPRTWMDLQAHDRVLGQAWGIALLERGLLVNPNEKFYVSIAHTDEDVERTLEICDAAFSQVSQTR